MGCVQCLVKYTLFFFNLAFVLMGAAFIGVGVAVLLALDSIGEMMPVISAIPIVFIVVGSVVFLIAFFGCCGAITQNRCFLILYVACMLVLMGGNIWLTVVIYNSFNWLTDTIEDLINTAFEEFGHDLTGLFRALEEIFRCCGTTGRESYDELPFIPPTCCANITCHDADADSFYDGCTGIFTQHLVDARDIVGIVAIVTICIIFLAIVFSLFLTYRITRAIRAKKHKQNASRGYVK